MQEKHAKVRMQLDQLVTFVRVAEEASFTRAGEIIGLTQPAVTRQVAALERELGASLIERGGRSFRLTAAGEVVLDHAREVLAVLDRMDLRVRELVHPERGEVSVACVTTVGLYTLPALIAEFGERFPDVRLRLWSGRMDGVLDRLQDGSADIGLVSAAVVNQRLEVIPLFDDPVIAVAAPSLARELPNPIPLARFAELDIILFQSPSRFRTIVDAALQQAGILPNVAMEFDSHEAVRSATYLGRAVAMVPQQAVPNDLTSGALVQLQVDGLPPITRTVNLVLRKNRPHLPAVDNFAWLVAARYVSGTWKREGDDFAAGRQPFLSRSFQNLQMPSEIRQPTDEVC